MADQETLISQPHHNPLNHGLWARYVDGDTINHAAWLRACAEGGYVGTCRRCGDYLKPRYPNEVSDRRTDYEAHCRRETTATIVDGKRVVDGCGWECNASDGRILHRSSRTSERKKGVGTP